MRASSFGVIFNNFFRPELALSTAGFGIVYTRKLGSTKLPRPVSCYFRERDSETNAYNFRRPWTQNPELRAAQGK